MRVLAISRSTAWQALAKCWCLPASETATAGMPSRKASVAAATVPEYSVSSPMFGPWLMPENTMSGLKSRKPVTATCTQSVGVPLT
ncbi:hypothetical protein D3C78_1572360 [compost metagenome]